MHDIMETIEISRLYRETKPFENGTIGINGISLSHARGDHDHRGIVNISEYGETMGNAGGGPSAALPSGQIVIG